ncbi:MAG: class I SAM-dependent methyltransferase [Ruminococcus sp.]
MTDKETSSAKSVSISGRKREGTTEKTEFAVVTGRETCVRAFLRENQNFLFWILAAMMEPEPFTAFQMTGFSRVIGLEYNQQLVERANSQYGNTKFSFYQMDVDRDSFSADFQKLCTEPEDREFDLICLSFVLMHLHDGEKLLRTLKNFWKKGGVIFITESNDRISTLAPDEKNLLGQFLDILKEDKYAGKRNRSAVPGWLTNCGLRSSYPCLVQGDFRCRRRRTSSKKKIFSRPFSYLPEDVEILLAEEPDNRKISGLAELAEEEL